ncbi:hypothetical protein HUT16_01295 [Kitasatospora sp. NA04385]|uniref:hypothetical protein n=1 Tax=Kitasatospora sp. NA04385 TaxID=2742135 RepID=UPI0015906096|nr:hypothetical protein [Kitasatospora sp. NA04385]QKW17877.1 hypothetical protein HUT16_01295 [Kitasatospora sp. NA04385]
MSSVYELSIVLNLREDLSDQEEAELRWHLGLGPQPEALRIVPRFPVVVEDGSDGLIVEDDPRPLLGRHDAAVHVGGALVSALVRPEHSWNGPWALTVRQEIHPDDFDLTGELLTWLAAKADDRHRPSTGTVRVGWTRFYESDRLEPLEVRGGVVAWP